MERNPLNDDCISAYIIEKINKMKENHLNSIEVNGNTIAWMAEKDMDKDLYHCQECDGYVPEDEWNSKRNMCFSCWWKI